MVRKGDRPANPLVVAWGVGWDLDVSKKANSAKIARGPIGTIALSTGIIQKSTSSLE